MATGGFEGVGVGEMVEGDSSASLSPQLVTCPSCKKNTRLLCEYCWYTVPQKQVNIGKVKNLFMANNVVTFSTGHEGSDLGLLTRSDDKVFIRKMDSLIEAQTHITINIGDGKVTANLLSDLALLEEMSDYVTMLRTDWSDVTQENKKTEMIVTQINNEQSIKFSESILEEILNRRPLEKVIQSLYKDFRLRVVCLTKGMEVLMEVEAGREAYIFENEADIRKRLLEVVPEAERNNVTWNAYTIPVQCEDDKELAAKVDKESMETVNGALSYACQYGNYQTCLKLLKHRNADVTVLDRNGKTPFHIACQYGQSHILDLLLEKGAQVNQPDREGLDPLHLACDPRPAGNDIEEGKRQSTVQWLLQHGVDVHLKTPDGMTAEDLANMGGYQSIMQLLQSHSG